MKFNVSAASDGGAKQQEDNKKSRILWASTNAFAIAFLSSLRLLVAKVTSSSLWRHHRAKIVVSISVLLGWILHRQFHPTRTAIAWAPGLLHKDKICQKPLFQPYVDGCPASCAAYRTAPVLAMGEKSAAAPLEYYRLNVEWSFGQAGKHEQLEGIPEFHPFRAYDKGWNYQCSEEFLRSFVHATQHVSFEATEDIPGLVVSPVETMTLSLMNLCCLTKEEALAAQQCIQEWLYKQYPFSVDVQFDQLQCWQMTPTRIENLIMANEESQRRLMSIHQDLRDFLQQHQIPISIERTSQTPFHIPLNQLVQAPLANPVLEGEQQTSIDTATVYKKMIHPISVNKQDTWTGDNAMRITHPPHVSKTPMAHDNTKNN